MTSEHFASSSRVVNLIRSTMAFALFRTESDQRINCPIRTNTQRFCLARAVHYQPAPHHPGTRQEPFIFACDTEPRFVLSAAERKPQEHWQLPFSGREIYVSAGVTCPVTEPKPMR